MPPRLRKFVGGLLLLAFIAVYALAAALAGALWLDGAPKFIAAVYYGVAGFVWLVPAALLIWWMQARG